MLPPDTSLSSFASSGGELLALRDWPLSEGWPVRGVVLLVHGLGEHMGRYLHVASRLNQWGFAVRGYDQYGHGESGGVRGDVPDGQRLLADLAALIDDTRLRMDERLPLIVLGHGLGGLVAARLVSLHMRRVQALVLSSPSLDVGLSAPRKALLSVAQRLLPRLRVSSGVGAGWLSHDQTVGDIYRNDALVHDRVSLRLAHFIVSTGAAVIRQAPLWPVQTLLMYAGQDRVVSPAGSQAFAALAPPDRVSVQAFPMHYHELFNELDSAPVFSLLRDWLTARFAPLGRVGGRSGPGPAAGMGRVF